MFITGSIFEGVYKTFDKAGGDINAFDSDIWINKQITKTLESLDKLKKQDFTSKDYPLPIVVAMTLQYNCPLRILDFGDGTGIQYIELIAKVPEALEKIDYHVVDGKSSIDNRPAELDQFKKLYFNSDLNNLSGKFDIIHIGSTLQYIENWQTLLETLNEKFNPQYFVLSDLMAGDISNFVSHQIFYDKKIPVWMFNKKDIITLFSQHNFEITYHSYFLPNILGSNELPNYNLPSEQHLKHTLNLIFKKFR